LKKSLIGLLLILATFVCAFMILYLIGTQDSNKETTVRGLKENLVEALDRKEGDPNRTSWTNEVLTRNLKNRKSFIKIT